MKRKIKTAYFSGIIDGEGSVGYQSRGAGRTKRLTIEVKMTELSIIEALKDHFGTGTIFHRPAKNPKWKDQWRWRVTDKQARHVYREIEPYLMIKQVK